MRDLYEVLDIENDADESQLKIAYRKAALRWHPGACSARTSRSNFTYHISISEGPVKVSMDLF